uniref:Uncharacterized protein n=1 Tax=Moniliophthora roreri TaxID=221103 RepID=A0A0W0EUM8_MONRR
MSDLSLETYKFIAIWVEAIFWGMYTVLFGICMYVLLSARKRCTTGTVNKPFLATAMVLYFLSTIHFLNDFARGYIGFLEYGDKGGPKKYYEEISVWHYLFREAIYMTIKQVIAADALLVYRLYIVWGRKKRFTAAPLVLLTATAVFGYLTVWGFSRVEPGQNDHAASIYHWAVGLFSLSLVTNVVVTGLIGKFPTGNYLAVELHSQYI